MPTFRPLLDANQLPAVNASIEQTTMDWKLRASATDFHKAKDVAAFANHLGGTLIIGAEEANGQLVRYEGASIGDAGPIRAAYDNAVRNRCEPLPLIDFAEFPAPGDVTKRIVIVNVWPSLNLIGVRVAANGQTEGYGGAAFVFPVRTGTNTNYITPGQLSMYLTPQIRRTVVMLAKIPAAARIRINFSQQDHRFDAVIASVKEEDNVLELNNTDGTRMQSVPLDSITNVYETWDSQRNTTFWRVISDLPRTL